MKARGLFVVFILSAGIVYLLWFTRTAGKTLLETKVDQNVQAHADLTKINMQALQKIVISYMASEGQTPKSLQDLRDSGLLGGGSIDAWGKSIQYERLSDSSFRLISAGKDGIFSTQDDIVLEY